MNKPNMVQSVFLYLVILAFLLSGCNPDSHQACPEPGGIIPNPGPGEEYVTLTIQNNTCMSICEVLVSPDHCEYMGGVNWVADHPLRSEASVSQNIPPGKYAVWVELCTEEFRADEHIKVRSETNHIINDDPAPPCGTSLLITNNSAVPICKLWISNSGSVYDSRNWIGSEQIRPGETLHLTLRADTYDIKAEDCDGNSLRFEGDVLISGHQDWLVPQIP